MFKRSILAGTTLAAALLVGACDDATGPSGFVVQLTGPAEVEGDRLTVDGQELVVCSPEISVNGRGGRQGDIAPFTGGRVSFAALDDGAALTSGQLEIELEDGAVTFGAVTEGLVNLTAAEVTSLWTVAFIANDATSTATPTFAAGEPFTAHAEFDYEVESTGVVGTLEYDLTCK